MGNGPPEPNCWQCGAPLRANERYCDNCGADQHESGQDGPPPQQGGPPPQQGGPPPQGQGENQPPPQGQPPGGPQQGQGPPPQQGGPPPQGQQPPPQGRPRQNQSSSNTWILIVLAVIGGGLVLTVVLSAVIGSFVLGLGDTTPSAPSAAFDYEYNETTDELEVTHTGGDELDAEQVSFEGDVEAAGSSWADVTGQDTVRAGDTVSLSVTADEYVLRLIWVGEDSPDEVIGEHSGSRPASTTAQQTTRGSAMAALSSPLSWHSFFLAARA